MWKKTFIWSEIASGFGEPRGTPPPRISRSTHPVALVWFVGGKTRKIAINSFCSNVARQVALFAALFYTVALAGYQILNKHFVLSLEFPLRHQVKLLSPTGTKRTSVMICVLDSVRPSLCSVQIWFLPATANARCQTHAQQLKHKIKTQTNFKILKS